MQQQKFGNLDFKVSAAGCGALCLPPLNGNGAATTGVEVPHVTKIPGWKIESLKDFDKYFNERLAQLQTEQAISPISRLVASVRDGYETLKEMVNGHDQWVMYLNTADKQPEKVI
jgi:hypothetical protein